MQAKRRQDDEPGQGNHDNVTIAGVASIRGSKRECAIARCEGTIDIVAALFNVSSKEVRSPSRGEIGVARVRQIAMYAAHCALGLSMREVGIGFGRDRTTVLHACHLVEDLREDAEFDRMVQTAERIVIAVLQPGGVA